MRKYLQMDLKPVLLFALLILSLGACKLTRRKNPPPVVDLTAKFRMIDSADIYDHIATDTFVPSAAAIGYARKLYLNAIDLFVNKNDANKSLPLFVRSIRIAPENKTYLKYAEALYAADNYGLARETYYYLQYDSNIAGDVQMGLAKCSGMLDDTSAALSMLNAALEAYPFDLKNVNEDKAFAKLHDLEPYKIMLLKYNTSDANRKTALLAMFEKNFPKAALPYNIIPDSLYANVGSQIDFRYTDFIAGMTDGRFSRMVENEYEYVAAINLSPLYKSFVYRRMDFGDDKPPVYYYLITIDTAGKKVSEQEIACSCSPLSIKTLTIDTGGIIEVKEIEQTWKFDPLEKGYEGNEVVKQEVKATNLYQVAGDGNIVAIKDRPVKPNNPIQANN